MVRAQIATPWIAALIVWAAANASAEPAAVAVVEVEIGGDGAPELQPQLATSIASGLEDAGVKPVKLDAVRKAIASKPGLMGCLSSTCLDRVGELTGADAFIRARVSADGADYNLALELYDREQLINKLELPCSVCTISELNKAVRVTTSKLLADAPEEPVQVVIRSEPSGATLTIDGVRRGPAPFEGPLARGSHEIIAEIGSGRVERQVVVSTESSTEPIVIELPETSVAPDGSPVTTAGPVDNQLGTIKWVTGGAAVTALATGAVLIAVDGRGTCNNPNRECQRELNTSLAGWITAGGGLALAGAAGWMFWIDSKGDHERDRNLGLAPRQGGAMAVFSGSF